MKHDHTDRPGAAGVPDWETDPAVARALARVTGAAVMPPDVDAALAASRAKRANVLETPKKQGAGTPAGRFGVAVGTKRRGLTGVAVAGMAIAIALVTWLGRPNTRPSDETTHVYTTNARQSASFLLNDGTQVDLGPGTTLRLLRFGTRTRTVVLDAGEAHFKVARSTGAPFIVRSGTVATRVLGTTFFVRHEATGSTHVAVAEGKVSVDNLVTPHGVTLSAGVTADVGDSTLHVGSLEGLPLNEVQEDGEVVFRDTPVPTILAALTHWYGYQFLCADTSLTQHKVTVGMNMRSSSAALSKLEQILNANMTIAGDTVTLTARQVRRPAGPTRNRPYDIWTPSREVGR